MRDAGNDSDVIPVRADKRQAPLGDLAEMCGARFVRVASVSLPREITYYDVRAVESTTRGTGHLVCPRDRYEHWQDATLAYLAEVVQATADLYRAHGGTSFSMDLRRGSRSWSPPTKPFPWPGRRRRTAARSAAAQREFLARLERAAAAYLPVRDEIASRLASRAARPAAPPATPPAASKRS
ncbi:hypothetical protein, partial [Streptomyces sp. URMC 123]|uniref:hypothetical protein n=1 Tax=Streptomyces sp. URMC 123 TaxID=3423403 RepID=UPI003F1A2F63